MGFKPVFVRNSHYLHVFKILVPIIHCQSIGASQAWHLKHGSPNMAFNPPIPHLALKPLSSMTLNPTLSLACYLPLKLVFKPVKVKQCLFEKNVIQKQAQGSS